VREDLICAGYRGRVRLGKEGRERRGRDEEFERKEGGDGSEVNGMRR
jgi:hypothetical protein